MIEFAYNDHIHSSIRISLFSVLHDKKCSVSITLSTSNTRFKRIKKIIREIKNKLGVQQNWL